MTTLASAETGHSGYPPGDLRVSDADRERALAELNEAFQAGRITAAELDERSGQVLRARTGNELTAPLADLPPGGVPSARAVARERSCRRAVAARIAMGASAAAAVALAATAAADGLSGGAGASPQSQALREDLARQGLSAAASAVGSVGDSSGQRMLLQLARHGVPVPVQAAPGFDWVGTVIPAAFAVLLVALIIVLRRVSRVRSG